LRPSPQKAGKNSLDSNVATPLHGRPVAMTTNRIIAAIISIARLPGQDEAA
jgi:hypothetical protein